MWQENKNEVFREASHDYDCDRNHRHIPVGDLCEIFGGTVGGDSGLPAALDSGAYDSGGIGKEGGQAGTDRIG